MGKIVEAGETLQLPGGASVTLHTPYVRGHGNGPHRLWIASLSLPYALQEYLEEYGFPIRYSYVKEAWPSSYYQTVYARVRLDDNAGTALSGADLEPGAVIREGVRTLFVFKAH